MIKKTGSAWCVRASAVACASASEYAPTHRDGIGDCLALLLSAILQHLVNLFLHPCFVLRLVAARCPVRTQRVQISHLVNVAVQIFHAVLDLRLAGLRLLELLLEHVNQAFHRLCLRVVLLPDLRLPSLQQQDRVRAGHSKLVVHLWRLLDPGYPDGSLASSSP